MLTSLQLTSPVFYAQQSPAWLLKPRATTTSWRTCKSIQGTPHYFMPIKGMHTTAACRTCIACNRQPRYFMPIIVNPGVRALVAYPKSYHVICQRKHENQNPTNKRKLRYSWTARIWNETYRYNINITLKVRCYFSMTSLSCHWSSSSPWDAGNACRRLLENFKKMI